MFQNNDKDIVYMAFQFSAVFPGNLCCKLGSKHELKGDLRELTTVTKGAINIPYCLVQNDIKSGNLQRYLVLLSAFTGTEAKKTNWSCLE